ncbi:MAG: hypothetical protein MUE68_02990 [Bacteroidetes bacterium]|nr:hypothetical protein [Bacteroidota bacterium]
MPTTPAPRKRIAAFIPLIAALLALQCIEAPLEPIAPTWETQISIPLADIKPTLGEALSDAPNVQTDASGGYTFEDTQGGQPVHLVALDVDAQPAAEQVSVGRIEISGFPSQSAEVKATSLNLAEGNWPAPPLPPFPGASTTLPSLSLGDTSFFAYAVIDTGSLTMSITNTLPMSVTFANDIVLKNNVPGIDTNDVANFPFGTLASGQSKSISAPLNGKVVWGLQRLAPVGVTIAGRAGPFTITSTSGLQFGFSSTNLRVESARALVPPQQVVAINDTVIVIDDTVSVRDARFKQGSFKTRIVNNLDLQVGVRLQIDNFQGVSSMQPLSILRTIYPKSVFDTTFNLPDLRLSNPTPDTMGTRVKFSVGIETITSAAQKATIASSDFVRAEFNPESKFVLESIEGRIKPTTFAFNSGASGVNIGEAAEKFSGQFTFDSVRINIGLGMTGGYKVRYSLRLEARNRKYNKQASIVLPPPVGMADTIFVPSPGALVTIPLGDPATLNGFLSNFFPNFPDTFIVRGTVTVNPDFALATIADTAKLYQAVHVQFPLRLALAGGKIEDKIGLGEEANFPTEFAQDIKQASLRFSVGNRIPAQLGFQLRLFRRLTPTSPVDTVLMIPTDGLVRSIAAATVDASGNATGETPSHFDISLTTAQVQQFNQADSMLFRFFLQTSGSGTQVVRFRTSDYVRVRLSGDMTYIVNRQN